MIYFARMCSLDAVKIGFTGRIAPEARLAELEYQFGTGIELLGVARGQPFHERRLHRWFAPLWLCGELFKPHPFLLSYAERSARNYPVDQLLGFAGDDLATHKWQDDAFGRDICVRCGLSRDRNAAIDLMQRPCPDGSRRQLRLAPDAAA